MMEHQRQEQSFGEHKDTKMPRYYNKDLKTEVLVGVHFELPVTDPIVELNEDHMFFKPIPEGKQWTYDANNIPNGYEDIPPNPNQYIYDAVEELNQEGVSQLTMTSALWINEVTGDNSYIMDITDKIIVKADAVGLSVPQMIQAVNGGVETL